MITRNGWPLSADRDWLRPPSPPSCARQMVGPVDNTSTQSSDLRSLDELITVHWAGKITDG
jgi:hypothetical protein